ncbi:MAG: type IV pilus biogenesis/stability protein PilW [Gammaproteobacteria bacterium]|nr:type IV pilus biogenesis/stability protein PilW [Gammaproteobacteria bacterium]
MNRLHRCTCVLLFLGASAGCVSSGSTAASGTNDANAAAFNLQLGVTYLQQGNLVVAKDKLERALRQNPNSPAVHSAMALLYERLGDPQRADAEHPRALARAPGDPEVLNNYAVYLCRNGRSAEGVRRFEQAAANPLYRTPWAAYTNAGVCLRAAQRDAEAEQRFVRALQVQPGYAEAVLQLADLELATQRAAAALKRVLDYLASNGATPDLLLLGWRAADAQQERGIALGLAQRLRTEFPDSLQARQLPGAPPPAQ